MKFIFYYLVYLTSACQCKRVARVGQAPLAQLLSQHPKCVQGASPHSLEGSSRIAFFQVGYSARFVHVLLAFQTCLGESESDYHTVSAGRDFNPPIAGDASSLETVRLQSNAA